MREVTPHVFLIGKTVPDKEEIRRWLDYVGATDYVIEMDVTAGEQLVQLCGKRCYMSFQPGLNPNVTRIRTDMSEFIDNILKVGHGSVLEHAVYNFAIESVSRVFTAEMNRHRAGMAISEGSMRFIRFTDIPFWRPNSLRPHPSDSDSIASKKTASWAVFKTAIEFAEKEYQQLVDIWAPELSPTSKDFHMKKHITSMMRRIIPIGVATGGVWTGNLRALRHIFTMRCSPAAEEEILEVGCLLLERMMHTEPTFFKDFVKDEQGFWRPQYLKV